MSIYVCVCLCVHVYAHLTQLQMSTGRAKCPSDDSLHVRVCLWTHLALIVCFNEQRHMRKHRLFVSGTGQPLNHALNHWKTKITDSCCQTANESLNEILIAC